MEKKIRGGALIARALKDKGIDKVFTLSGGLALTTGAVSVCP